MSLQTIWIFAVWNGLRGISLLTKKRFWLYLTIDTSSTAQQTKLYRYNRFVSATVSAGLAKGKTIWEYQTTERIASTPMISGDRVVFGSCDRSIYCLNKATGALVWRYRTDNAVMGSPMIKDGVVYIGASDGS